MTRVLFISLLVLAEATLAAEPTTLRGEEAEAIALATKIFKSKQGSTYHGRPVYGDLRHYSVELERRG